MPLSSSHSGSSLLATADAQFLLRDEMRATRLALEFAKADLLLRDWGILSTVIVFGSARTLSPEAAEILYASETKVVDDAFRARLTRQVHWYQTAREFGRIVSERGGALTSQSKRRENVITTGGGPGIMEAANRGASEAGAPSIGLTIVLPHEQVTNPYVTPELTFRFRYFAVRKMHFAIRARALAIFPGGFGTLDELFELLTLRQTGKTAQLPIVLFDRSYWKRVVDFDALVEFGAISRKDLDLFCFVDTAEAAWQRLVSLGLLARIETTEDV